MQRIKRVIIISISLLCMIGCANKQSVIEDYTYILFATPLKEHPVWLRAYDGFQKACDEKGYKCDWIGPSTIDIKYMNQVIETGILQKADAIVTQGVVDPALLKKAYASGIPVILVDSDMPDSYRTAYFGKDFKAQAQLFLDDVEAQLGKDEPLKIAIQVAELSFDIATQQVNQVREVFSSHPGGFEIVTVSESKSDKVRAKKEWEAIFQNYDDINVTISFAGESVASCYESATSLQKEKELLIYGVDDVEETMQLLKEGKISGSIIAPFYDYGYNTISYLSTYFQTKEYEDNMVIPINIELITPAKVEAYEASLP